jgi:hypothetical protein
MNREPVFSIVVSGLRVQTWYCLLSGPVHRSHPPRSRQGAYGTRREEYAGIRILFPSMGFRPFTRSGFCSSRKKSILLFTNLLAVAFACECFLHAFLFAWFQVKGVAFHLFDNVFRLHLPLKTTQSILQRFAFLNTYFCQD